MGVPKFFAGPRSLHVMPEIQCFSRCILPSLVHHMSLHACIPLLPPFALLFPVHRMSLHVCIPLLLPYIPPTPTCIICLVACLRMPPAGLRAMPFLSLCRAFAPYSLSPARMLHSLPRIPCLFAGHCISIAFQRQPCNPVPSQSVPSLESYPPSRVPGAPARHDPLELLGHWP